MRLLSRSQHPHEVARHAARLAARCARQPSFRVETLGAIAPLLRSVERSVDGREWPAALHAWARQVRHVREPGAVGELLLKPARVVAWNVGDCDDIATAVAAMAAHVGLPAAVMALWTGPSSAHAVAVVGDDWYGAPRLRWVIDPEQPAPVPVADAPYRYGRLFGVGL